MSDTLAASSFDVDAGVPRKLTRADVREGFDSGAQELDEWPPHLLLPLKDIDRALHIGASGWP